MNAPDRILIELRAKGYGRKYTFLTKYNKRNNTNECNYK